jgi:hypothetical protein
MLNEIQLQYGKSNKPSQVSNPIVTELKNVVDRWESDQLEDVMISEKKLKEILANIKNAKHKVAEAKNRERVLISTIAKMKELGK